MRRGVLCISGIMVAACQSVGGAEAAGHRAGGSCDSASARAEVGRTVDSFFAALASDDFEALRKVTTADFHAFDIGKKYDAQQLSGAIAKAHAEGRIINWNLGPKQLNVDCTIATAVWENVGSTGTAGKLQPRTWLESAILVRSGKEWRVQFLHSTPKDLRP